MLPRNFLHFAYLDVLVQVISHTKYMCVVTCVCVCLFACFIIMMIPCKFHMALVELPYMVDLWLKLIGMNSLIIMWFFDSPPQTLHIRQFYQKNLLNHLHGIIIIIKLTYWGFYFYFLSG